MTLENLVHARLGGGAAAIEHMGRFISQGAQKLS
jgi:hypothetical protein